MKIRYTIICLLASLGVANAQYQNFDISTPDTNAKTYIGRDYVKFLPGYKFIAGTGVTLDAKIQSGLTTPQTSTFLATANPTGNADITQQLTAINTTLAVGQIPISSSVSPSGAKCYNVPIEIVPGRQGFQPNISLSYNSQAGNGVVGMGWSITGLSSIERVNKNMFFDGLNDVPNLQDKDAFMLDGVRLIEKSRTDDQIKYETVQGNITVTAFFVCVVFSRIETLCTTDIGYFKVLYPNGSAAILGSTGNTSAKLSYPITTLTDLNGSIITYSYLPADNVDLNGGSNNEVYYIDEINYGQCSDMPNFAKVKFNYKNRDDQIFSLQSTKSTIYRQRLSSIEISANPDLIRTYKLTYSNTDPRIPSYQSDLSRLNQIDCSAGPESLNPLKFYYGEAGGLTTSVQPTALASSNFNLKKLK